MAIQDLTTLGGDIYNALSERHIVCRTMLYSQGKWTMKIPKKIPIRDGILKVTYYNANCSIEIMWHSVFGVWIKSKILDTIDCLVFSDYEHLVREVCDKIESFYRK